MSASASDLKTPNKIVKSAFPVPKPIDQERLKSNGKLLTAAEILRIKLLLQGKPLGRYSKKELKVPYGILHGKNGLYAVYNVDEPKLPKQFEIGSGDYGIIKFLQNLETGEWCVLKTSFDPLWSELDKLIALGDAVESEIFHRDSKKYEKRKYEIVMRYHKGRRLFDVFNDIHLGKLTISDLERFRLIVRILEGYKVIYDKKIRHCDIKSDNLIYDEEAKVIKFIDFGLAFGTAGPSDWDDREELTALLKLMAQCLLIGSSPPKLEEKLILFMNDCHATLPWTSGKHLSFLTIYSFFLNYLNELELKSVSDAKLSVAPDDAKLAEAERATRTKRAQDAIQQLNDMKQKRAEMLLYVQAENARREAEYQAILLREQKAREETEQKAFAKAVAEEAVRFIKRKEAIRTTNHVAPQRLSEHGIYGIYRLQNNKEASLKIVDDRKAIHAANNVGHTFFARIEDDSDQQCPKNKNSRDRLAGNRRSRYGSKNKLSCDAINFVMQKIK